MHEDEKPQKTELKPKYKDMNYRHLQGELCVNLLNSLNSFCFQFAHWLLIFAVFFCCCCNFQILKVNLNWKTQLKRTMTSKIMIRTIKIVSELRVLLFDYRRNWSIYPHCCIWCILCWVSSSDNVNEGSAFWHLLPSYSLTLSLWLDKRFIFVIPCVCVFFLCAYYMNHKVGWTGMRLNSLAPLVPIT